MSQCRDCGRYLSDDLERADGVCGGCRAARGPDMTRQAGHPRVGQRRPVDPVHRCGVVAQTMSPAAYKVDATRQPKACPSCNRLVQRPAHLNGCS